MKFGIQLYRDIEETVQLGKLLEKVGFDYIWVADVPAIRETTAYLTALAMTTKKIRLGTAIAGAFTRHICVWATTVATMQELSKGRFSFGLSVGGFLPRSKMGMKIKKPAKAIREHVEVYKKLFAGEVVSYKGEEMTLNDFKLAYPIDPHPTPIYIGARGPKMLELTGEVADGLLTEGSIDTLANSQRYLKKGAEKADRSLANFDVSYLPTAFWIAKDVSRKEMDMLKMSGAPSILDSTPEIHKLLGLDKLPLDLMKKALMRGDFGKIPQYLPDDILREFSIIGDVETCISKIEELEKKAGMTQLILVDPVGPDTVEVLKTFGEKIIPAFK